MQGLVMLHWILELLSSLSLVHCERRPLVSCVFISNFWKGALAELTQKLNPYHDYTIFCTLTDLELDHSEEFWGNYAPSSDGLVCNVLNFIAII